MTDNIHPLFGYQKFLEMRASGEWSILNEDDPIANVAHRVQDLLFDTEDLFGDVVKLTLRDMGLPQLTGVGGDESDEEDFFEQQLKKFGMAKYNDMYDNGQIAYLQESDPRYPLYWEILANIWNQIFGQCIASQKHRYTPEAMRRRLASKKWHPGL